MNKLEIENKIEMIRKYLSTRNMKACYVDTAESFAWITGGEKNYVTMNSIQTECGILITHSSIAFVTQHSEIKRLKMIFKNDIFEYEEHEWYESYVDVLKKLRLEEKCLIEKNDLAFQSYLKKQRIIMNQYEFKRLEYLGALSVKIFESSLAQILPTDKEREVKAKIAYKLIANGLEPVLIIISGAASLEVPHNISGEFEIGKRCTAVLCSKYKGLIVSLTRMISFDSNKTVRLLPSRLKQLEACALYHTNHEKKWSDVFVQLVSKYDKLGLSEAWKELHQGGITGYKLKEYFIDGQTTLPLKPNTAFAWNISVGGCKLEDTYITLSGGKMLGITDNVHSVWPHETVQYNNERYCIPGILCIN